jgi:V/A-type H+-transporting ATPase subunit A
MSANVSAVGEVIQIAGPVVGAIGLEEIRVFDVVRVGEMGLIGEVIRLVGDLTTIQVYEDTSGIRVGETVINTGLPLVANLGPGLLGMVYDGLQRPLTILAKNSGNFIQRGVSISPLPEDIQWDFTPCVSINDYVNPGDVLGTVPESQSIKHRIMVPPRQRGRIVKIHDGKVKISEPVAVLEIEGAEAHQYSEVKLDHRWPVRQPRPILSRLPPDEPLISGTRIIDAFFPVAKGGSAIIPGGFGTGKTVVEHSLARWSDADVVVYIGCGERGNEMTEVLEQFPLLEDPRTGTPLMERTVLIANTSNMPVAAREASIYTGITIAEYYRDMGYDVLVLADSTSRWGEALREISGRLEEMPGEEGYPAYLAARLAEFYERSGRVLCLGNPIESSKKRRGGSITVVGAVSPPGGDFSEPMTQNSMRLVGSFWALDYNLSRRRHFPAINWTSSFSLYDLNDWFHDQVADDWSRLIREAMILLQREVELLEIVQLVGPDALADHERAILFVARMLREDFLQQSAYHEIDRYCPPEKTYWMLKSIMDVYQHIQSAVEANKSLTEITQIPVLADFGRIKELEVDKAKTRIQSIMDRVRFSFEELGVS